MPAPPQPAASNGHGSDNSPESVRTHLRRILESPAFKGSKRSQTFLEYAVQKVLSGEHDALKERNIAVDVFGRPPDANLTEDTIVRVGAREVRRRLAQCYALPEAAGDELHLDLPAASYVPEWHANHTERAAAQPPAEAPALAPKTNRARWLAAAASTAALAAVVWFAWPADPFHRFWRPFTAGGSVLIATAHPLVFHLSTRALSLDQQRSANPLPFMQRPPGVAPAEISGSDVVPVQNQCVGFGDMVAASEFTRMLGMEKVSVRLRLAT